jgi:cytochrome c biogenesis protein CcmG/thiol:disulfide interchange protein DsbE
MKKKLILASPFLIFLIVVLLAIITLYNKEEGIESKLKSGKEIFMPEFSLPELNDSNEVFSNSDLQGNYVLVNFFASWCSVCGLENDLLMRLSDAGKIAIYGVSWRDINQNTKKYLQKNGNPYLKIGVDGRGIFSKLLSVSGTPESFLINPEGKIIYYWQGAIDEDFFESFDR